VLIFAFACLFGLEERRMLRTSKGEKKKKNFQFLFLPVCFTFLFSFVCRLLQFLTHQHHSQMIDVTTTALLCLLVSVVSGQNSVVSNAKPGYCWCACYSGGTDTAGSKAPVSTHSGSPGVNCVEQSACAPFCDSVCGSRDWRSGCYNEIKCPTYGAAAATDQCVDNNNSSIVCRRAPGTGELSCDCILELFACARPNGCTLDIPTCEKICTGDSNSQLVNQCKDFAGANTNTIATVVAVISLSLFVF
jgi:hypothetical protein